MAGLVCIHGGQRSRAQGHPTQARRRPAAHNHVHAERGLAAHDHLRWQQGQLIGSVGRFGGVNGSPQHVLGRLIAHPDGGDEHAEVVGVVVEEVTLRITCRDEGHLVGDGALVPRTLSVNPSLTIMALATRLAEHLEMAMSGETA